ncbi:MAG: ABC transporter ATP-binding protein [Anaerolineales bacterium]|nr:ABC transporter ATP-binding protein [Anaerolineales bacterium]
MENGLTLTEIYKSFGDLKALSGVSFDVTQGEIVALLGPSGCGKSTLLNLIAGLDDPDYGSIAWNGESVAGIPPHQRGFGLMFQDYALFPHMNVFDNIAFGLRMTHLQNPEIKQRVNEALTLVGMQGFSHRDIVNLSGGEQQRVALARSLAPRPHLLMLDEPLGALDRTLRERLVVELGDILHQLHQTAIYVTHDQEEAFAFANRVVLLNAGKVEQIDSPQNIYHQPASEFVARFLGMDNIFKGVARQVDSGNIVESQIGTLPLPQPASGEITFLLRPDAVSLGVEGACHLKGRVARRSFRGSACRLTAEVNQTLLTFEFSTSQPIPPVGETVDFIFNPEEAIWVFQYNNLNKTT